MSARQSLLSAEEVNFFHVLRSVVRGRGYVFAQVSLGQLLESRSESYSAKTSQRNTYDRKTIDFLICDAQTLRPLVAIELDDSSHRKPSRQARDAKVDNLLAAAGLRLVRFPCRRTYDTRQIEAAIGSYLPGS